MIFHFKPNFFAILLNVHQQNPLKIQYLPQLSSENSEINSIKSDLSTGFPTTPRTPLNFNTVFSFNSI